MERAAVTLLTVFCLALSVGNVSAQLSSTFYSSTCPSVRKTVWKVVKDAIVSDTRMGASLLRLHFHDCFVQGCDGSVLLDDTSTFTGEKAAAPNKNTLRGFDVIDAIKTKLESDCPGVVSCADIVALAAQVSVFIVGGPAWVVQLGRRDSTTASFDGANSQIPSPASDVSTLTSAFKEKGLSVRDMVALSGAHTIGKAQCFTFRDRLYDFKGTGSPDNTVDASFLSSLQSVCPKGSSDDQLADLDLTTPNRFDTQYYRNLQKDKGLLTSDQVLFSTNGSDTVALVNQYARDWTAFWRDFKTAMVSMGNISPLTGTSGQIRKSCRAVNA